MRYILSFIVLFLSFSLFAVVVPQSETIGRIQIDIAEDSISSWILKGFKEEYTEDWIETYAGGDELFAVAYTPMLSELLPMTNVVISEEGKTGLSLYSLDSKQVVSIAFDGKKIIALSVKEPNAPSLSEENQSI